MRLFSLPGFNHLQQSAEGFPDMKRSTGLHICVFLFSVWLCSPALRCATLQKREAGRPLETSLPKRELGERGGRESAGGLENPSGSSAKAVWTAVSEDPRGASAAPSGAPLNRMVARGAKPRARSPTQGGLGQKSADAPGPTVPLSAADGEGQDKGSIGKEMLTTSVTTASSSGPEVFSATAGKEEPAFTRPLYNHVFTVGGEGKRKKDGPSSKHSSSPQFNTEEMLTTSPRTGFFKTVHDQSTISLLLVDQKMTTENGVLLSSMVSPEELTAVKPPGAEASLSLEMDDTTRDKIIASNVSVDLVFNEEWDDTKITSGQIKHTEHGHATQLRHGAVDADQAGGRTAAPLMGPTDTSTLKSEESASPGAAESLPVTLQEGELGTALTGQGMEEASSTPQGTLLVQHEEKISKALPDTVASLTDAMLEQHDPTRAMFKGPGQETGETSQESIVTLTSVHPTTEETTELPGLTDAGETASETQTISSISQLWKKKPESAAALTSHTASPSEGLSTVLGQDILSAVSEAVISPSEIRLRMEETASVAMATSASVSSEYTAAVPAVRRLSTTVAYGLDKLESEEGDEEDEEEDDDDDEEEDEEDDEEEEEDKDTDSTDESVEGDAELPAFTLPGLQSQDPLGDGRNPTQLEGLGYRVPDVLEWEQQNQGLVRNWMEKLKDKAGSMSGMLVPVGVGIAGAFFILGALYSIKIMNRRRRNGFKRHKKKREFNSMQDRVMLLADSSEDEF
ncbi:armadillo-like helical domain-containing protein 4 isoform X2 [Rhinatrema bivittatum]|uniref:armadillo-like helical domain-containing protein 4 isoform X2 n=1 Tax=Rhinatrema bivittatum TaxID=194408 RepID=UPI00112B18A8|nr:armadillo-like helical domain-containing protein 4 isoform X2 [Rhinatrema bivittatum]